MYAKRSLVALGLLLALLAALGCAAPPAGPLAASAPAVGQASPASPVASEASPAGTTVTPTVGSPVPSTVLTTALQDQGFAVQTGKMAPVDPLSLCCSGQLPNCLAFNAGAPYMGLLMPKAPGQTATSTLPWTFHLGSNEGLVLIGRTPPAMTYFSYEPWDNVLGQPLAGKNPVIGANIGDTINNLTIQTSGPKTDPFDRDTIIIFTGDQVVDSRVRAALRAAGYDERTFNTSVIPSSMVQLGVDAQADEMSMLHRTFGPRSQQAFDTYYNTPQLVLRVSLTDTAKLAPFPAPNLRVRGTGTTEMDLMPAMRDLRQAILDKHSSLHGTDLTTSVWLSDGWDGLQRQEPQYQPTRDTIYLRTDPLFSLLDQPDSFAIIYGVNHAATGKATYASAAVYADPNLMLGVTSENDSNYAGSAADYLLNDPRTDSLYAWKVARNCRGEQHCLEVKLSQQCDRLTIDDDTKFWFGFRLYLEPQTAVGPAFTEVIYDRAILFAPSAPSVTATP